MEKNHSKSNRPLPAKISIGWQNSSLLDVFRHIGSWEILLPLSWWLEIRRIILTPSLKWGKPFPSFRDWTSWKCFYLFIEHKDDISITQNLSNYLIFPSQNNFIGINQWHMCLWFSKNCFEELLDWIVFRSIGIFQRKPALISNETTALFWWIG